jgi:hypothetical protein
LDCRLDLNRSKSTIRSQRCRPSSIPSSCKPVQREVAADKLAPAPDQQTSPDVPQTPRPGRMLRATAFSRGTLLPANKFFTIPVRHSRDISATDRTKGSRRRLVSTAFLPRSLSKPIFWVGRCPSGAREGRRSFAAATALHVENEGFKLLGHFPGLRFAKRGEKLLILIRTAKLRTRAPRTKSLSTLAGSSDEQEGNPRSKRARSKRPPELARRRTSRFGCIA